MRGLSVALLASVLAAGWGGALASADAGAGNGYYWVFVDEQPGGKGIGAFTVATGPDYPAGAGRAMLFGGETGDAWSSYTTVRSYTTGTDYVQTLGGASSGFLVEPMDAYGSVSPIGATGYRTTYELPGAGETADTLRIVSEVNVNGASLAGSSVEITTTVTNLDPYPVSAGVRYLLDLKLAEDDGPTLAAVNPTQQPLETEASYPRPGFAGWRSEDNTLSAPTLSVFGTASAGYPGIVPASTAPDLLQFVYWPEAYGVAFDYTTAGRDVASPAGLDDSAVLYYFGSSEGSAIRLDPQQSVTVSVSLFASPPGLGPEVCDNGADDDGDRLADGADADCRLSPSPTLTPISPPATGSGPGDGLPGQPALWLAGGAALLGLVRVVRWRRARAGR